MRSNPSQAHSVPDSFVGVNIEGPSSEGFYFYPVYRTKGGEGRVARNRESLRIYPDDATHGWALRYDPEGAGSNGKITVSLDGRTISLELEQGQKAAGTQFDRFGIVTTWIDGNGQSVYFDDLTYTVGQK